MLLVEALKRSFPDSFVAGLHEDFERLTPTNWWIITGGPSTGKSALLEQLQLMGYKTVPEAARVIIDEGIEEGKTVEQIRADEFYFQADVWIRKEELEDTLPEQELIFWDRGLSGDTDVYALKTMLDASHSNPSPTPDIFGPEIIIAPRRRYKGVFLLDRLPYEQDYARVESDQEAADIHEALGESYRIFGYNPIRIPVLPIKQRVSFLLGEARRVDSHFPPPPQMSFWNAAA